MRFWKPALFLFLIAILGWGMYDLVKERVGLEKDVADLSSHVQALQDENKKLAAQIEYYQYPENLIKELKSQFNYRLPDEKLLILVPSATGTRP